MTTATTLPTAATLESLLVRVEALERKRYAPPATEPLSDHDKCTPAITDDSVRRARRAVEEACITSAQWKWVPDNYYTLPLSQRAACLGAPSIQYLCKTLLMENRKCNTTVHDPTNPKFVLVIVQYAATLDVKKLTTAIRSLRKATSDRLPESNFDFRIASTTDNLRITGYSHNSVTPFGLLVNNNNKDDVTGRPVVVVSAALQPLHFLWMGGGHVHLKLGLALSEFCHAMEPNVTVADISQPRSMAELETALLPE